ncbi:Uncharacterized protein BP5553_04825 [Venustampulla echinocandica]|uniref:PLC-like phosphodiesterase n=1 Tax=Venustampulla echinocandica TaxID=2656787 RepID=A0A370TPE7_9HELO|nr:Uncharacterized protein BP5553_04825 [Venustampulla echinocandica]RDL37392.1 Uncharacterized protein BP5553_04825 [Venustampulla echinocandica]
MLSSLLAVSAAFLSLTGLAQGIPQAGVSSTGAACNNSPLLCDRNYNNITHMGAHDSAFLRNKETSFSTAGNQFYDVTAALSAGIRLLQAQVHNLSGALKLCHTSCSLLDGGSLESFLSDIKIWMDSNPNEVVTLLLVNSDNMPAATIGDSFTTSGISKYGFAPASTSGPMATWPTLQTLISANTRLVSFITNIEHDSTKPYLLPEFDYVFETAFGVSSVGGFNCTVDRPSSLGSGSTAVSKGYLGLLNHFLDIEQSFGITVPDVANIATTNSASTNTTGTAGTHGAQCQSEWGVRPTFILVDFFNVGPAIQTADQLNGISPVGRTSLSTAVLTAESSGAASTSGSGISWFGLAGFGMGVIALGNFVFL